MLRNQAYLNNSIVAINYIGEGDNALLCMTHKPDCCKPPNGNTSQGEFYYPNHSAVPPGYSSIKVHRWFVSTGGMMFSHQLEYTDVRFLTPLEWIEVSSSI